ncbi:EAL domain-containing protein [bacterium]|nr:MAG: EAL domain-containing protein [bacterium]
MIGHALFAHPAPRLIETSIKADERRRRADIPSVQHENTDYRRGLLREFLRARRARLLPRDVALPTHARRRFPGLRAEDVAELAGVSTKWYLLFENGHRERRFSLAFIQRVAEALQLGQRDRARFLRLALPFAADTGQRSMLTPAQEAMLRRRPAIARGLRAALARRQLSLAYQPIWCADRSRVTAVEALVRWRSAELGVVTPGEFVPIAEEVGLIKALGSFVLQEAFQQAKRWQRAGLGDIRLCVNLSPVQLRAKRFVQEVRALLEQTPLPPRLLELEITEHTQLDADPTVLAAVDALKALGVRVSIDDFGTGYSSFRSLKTLRAQAVKIDRSFVAELPGDPFCLAITRSIVALAHDLGLVVVAEGVEREEQSVLLQSMGCDELQGFLLSRPLSADQCTALLEARAAGPSMPLRPVASGDLSPARA